MKPWTRSSLRLLLWILLTSGGSAGATHDDPDEGNSRTSLMGGESSFQVKPKITVEVPVGEDAELQCSSQAGQGLVKWWQTPFGSFGDRTLGKNDPIGVNNKTLKILKATRSHSGFYNCHLVDSGGTTVISYSVNVVDKRSLRVTREDKTSAVYDLAPAVAASVLVTFLVAFTLGAFSRPYLMKCLQNTRCSKLFRMPINKKSSPFKDSAASKPSTPFKSPTKLFWSKNQPEEVGVEGAIQIDDGPDKADGPDGADGAQGGPEEETHIRPKRRSRVIKVYNYDEEGKRYDHVSEPAVAVEELEPGPRQRVMSLTRLSTIMSQVQTPDFSTNRKTTQHSSDTPDSP